MKGNSEMHDPAIFSCARFRFHDARLVVYPQHSASCSCIINTVAVLTAAVTTVSHPVCFIVCVDAAVVVVMVVVGVLAASWRV